MSAKICCDVALHTLLHKHVEHSLVCANMLKNFGRNSPVKKWMVNPSNPEKYMWDPWEVCLALEDVIIWKPETENQMSGRLCYCFAATGSQYAGKQANCLPVNWQPACWKAAADSQLVGWQHAGMQARFYCVLLSLIRQWTKFSCSNARTGFFDTTWTCHVIQSEHWTLTK